MNHTQTCLKASSFILITVLFFSYMSPGSSETEHNPCNVMVHFINVGWGDSIFIDTPEKDVLIDGGWEAGGRIVQNYLMTLNVTRIHLMIATHPHPDHINGLIAILNSTIEVDLVIFNNETHPQNFMASARNHNLTAACRGQIFRLSETANLTVLNPVQPLEFPPYDVNRHYNNVVIRLQVSNMSFLFTGDAGALTERSMLNSNLNLKSDVLKVGVHGLGETQFEEATTQAFLDAVNPTYAAISCNYTNGYWLRSPDRKVTARLLGKGILIYSTHTMGTIVASTNGTSINFSDNTKYPCLAELKGHTKAVYSTDWSPDGSTLASGSKDGTVRLWNTTTWETTLTINAHANGVLSVAWSPNGARLATGGVEDTVRIWDPNTGIQAKAFNVSASSQPYVYSVSWSPDDNRLAAGLSDGTVCIFDVETEEILQKLSGHTQPVIATEWSHDGSRLASGSIDQIICIWDSGTSSLISSLRANTTERNDINGLAWSLDDLVIAAAGQDGYVRSWNPETKSENWAMGKSYGWKRGVVWSPDRFVLAIGGQDCLVSLLHAVTGEKLAHLSGHLSPVWSLTWSPNGSMLASGSGEYNTDKGDTRVLVWKVDTQAIQIPTDLNGDGTVNIVDISIVAKAFGSKRGDSNWNITADVNHDEVVNIQDIAFVAKDFGKP